MTNIATATRTVLRYKLEPDNDGVSVVTTGKNPRLVHVGTGTSPTVCAWVEVDTDTADFGEVLRIASVGTGQTVPTAATYAGFVIEPCATGMAIRHLYLLPPVE